MMSTMMMMRGRKSLLLLQPDLEESVLGDADGDDGDDDNGDDHVGDSDGDDDGVADHSAVIKCTVRR